MFYQTAQNHTSIYVTTRSTPHNILHWKTHTKQLTLRIIHFIPYLYTGQLLFMLNKSTPLSHYRSQIFSREQRWIWLMQCINDDTWKRRRRVGNYRVAALRMKKKKLPSSTETWTEDKKQKTKTELNLKNCLENMVYFVVLQSRIFMKAKKNSLALIICKHVSLLYRPIWSKKMIFINIKISLSLVEL